MIKRIYFLSCNVCDKQNNAIYRHQYFITTRISWFAQPSQALEWCIEQAQLDALKNNIEIGPIIVLSFNRVK